jgi:hypothetical protein
MAVISGGNVIDGALRRVGDPTAEGMSYGGLRVIKASYSFASDGGAVGAINLLSSSEIPSGAIILGGLLEVVTPPTSGGAATVAIAVESAGDMVAAAAISGAPWSSAGRQSVVPVFTGATSVKTTAARNVTATVAVAALTAGVFNVYLVLLVTA